MQTSSNKEKTQIALHSLKPGSFNTYLESVKAIPALSREKEQELAKRSRDNDVLASQELVMHHLKFVVHIASGYKGYGFPQVDLIQEGNIGLMKAVRGFDPDVGVRLSTFAVHWVKSEIHEYLIKNYQIIKVATTKSQRKLFFNVRKLRSGMTHAITDQEAKQIAEKLSVPASDVKEMERRMDSPLINIDKSLDEDSSGDDLTLSGVLSDGIKLEDTIANKSENNWYKSELMNGLSNLDERSQHIVKSRFLSEKKATLLELSEKHQVSAERVRQLEAIALKKLKANIEERFKSGFHSTLAPTALMTN